MSLRHWAAAACLIAMLPAAHAWQTNPSLPWSVTTVVTRTNDSGETVYTTLAVRIPAGVPIRHLVLYPSPNGRRFLNTAGGNIALNLIGPWVRTAQSLNARGIAVAFADAPSDAQGREIGMRPPAEVRRDLRAVVAALRQSHPDVPVHLGLFGSAAAPVLDIASGIAGVARIAVVSGAFLNARVSDWRSLKQPVLLLHAPSASCAATPFIEAQFVALHNGFSLVQAGYEKPAPGLDCDLESQHILSGLETEFADTMLRFFEGTAAPKTIGHPAPPVAWREQCVTYPAPGLFGVNQLELTLLLPHGAGPFPVIVFNHGDMDIDSAYVRKRQRVRELGVAVEFLRQGIAVAVPARRGMGMSEGNYPGGFARYDGDATYKARVHAQDILPALDYLKTRPEIDAQRIILSGHSAGGFSASYLASTKPPGVIGVINFSGGRTDAVLSEGAAELNRMMVSAFAELGKTTRVPSLWVFAQNDSRYSPTTIRASHAAFVAAGANAKLVLGTPTADDGHFIYHHPALWRDALRGFLSEIGVAQQQVAVGQ